MEATININLKTIVASLLVASIIGVACFEANIHFNKKTDTVAVTQTAGNPFDDMPAPTATATAPASSTVPPFASAISPASATTTATGKKWSGKSFAKANNVSFNLAQSLYDKKDYFSSIIAYGEGWRNGCYNDNKGISCFFGMNVSYHTKTLIKSMASQSTTDLNQINALVAQAGVFPMLSSTSVVNFTTDQGQVFMQLSEKEYLASVNNSFAKAKTNLKITDFSQNEQAAMGYMAYRMGSIYPSLVNALVQYHKTGSDSDKQKVIDSIHIHYQIKDKDGIMKTMTDTRTAGAIQALFESPEAYATLLDKNPSYVSTLAKTVPAYKGINFTGNQPVDDQIPDVVGQIKEQAYENNEAMPFTGFTETAPAPAPVQRQVVRRGAYAAPSTWY
jgi:hypothetical protein